ncbi:MAG: hypothetical protein VW270_21505 [Candidatus Poseidoniales archaeon]
MIFILFASSTSVQAQTPSPEVEISCTPLNIAFDVYPGADTSEEAIICTISNPTSYEEKIELDESHGDAGILVDFEENGGNVVVVPAGGQVDVSITIIAGEWAESATHILQVNATVIEHNGVPPANVVSDSEDIEVTFNAYDYYTAFVENPIILTINEGEQDWSKSVELELSNNGNYMSTFNATTTQIEQDLDPYNIMLNTSVVTMQVASGGTSSFEVILGLSGNQGPDTTSWEVLANGTKLLYLNTSMSFWSEEVIAGNSYCHQCDPIVDLMFEIYLIEEQEDPCEQVQNTQSPWVCAYIENWEMESQVNSHWISFNIEAGNIPGNSLRFVNVVAYLTGDMDWCFPVYDADFMPNSDGGCGGIGLSYGLEEIESSFSKDADTMIWLGDFEDGCYTLTINAVSVTDSFGDELSEWNASSSTLEILVPENSRFRIGNVDCSTTDYSMVNGWNETTISEYEPPNMGSEDDDKDSESLGVPFIGLFATISMFMLAVLFFNNEQEDL